MLISHLQYIERQTITKQPQVQSSTISTSEDNTVRKRYIGKEFVSRTHNDDVIEEDNEDNDELVFIS